jgi:hypothetical protein
MQADLVVQDCARYDQPPPVIWVMPKLPQQAAYVDRCRLRNPGVTQQCCCWRPTGWVPREAQRQEVPALLADAACRRQRYLVLQHL